MKGNDQQYPKNCRINRKKAYIIIAFFVLLTSCASQPPQPLRVNLPSNPTVAQVLQAPDNYKGTRVRWGGVINKITNLKSETEIEVISRGLDKQARPKVEDITYGRFIARIRGFLEPSIFAANREITVVGTISGTVTRPIDEFEYTYPVVDVEAYHLWEPQPAPGTYYNYNWWMYDPWYWGYPWYPWRYPYPY
jgi:outer membrane lipoprotein